MQHVDALAFDAPNGTTVIRRNPVTGAFEISNDGGANFFILGNPSGRFEDDTLAFARAQMPNAGFDRAIGSTLTPITEVALSTPNGPVNDPTVTGGAVKFSAAAASYLALNPATASTYNPVLGSFGSKTTAWLKRVRALINAAAFTNGTSIVLCSLDNMATFGGASTSQIQLLSIGTTAQPGATQLFIRLTTGGVSSVFSAGPDGVLGGAGGVPINQMFTAALWNDGIFIRWAINDVFNQANKLDALLGQQVNLPADAVNALVWSNDLTIGNNFVVDAVSFAYCSEQENR